MATKEKPKDEMIPLPSAGKDLMVKVQSQVDQLSEQNKFLAVLMTAVVIVLFVSFMGLVIDSFIYRTEAYKEHKVTLEEERRFMNEEIKVRNDKIKDIELRVEFLETNMVNRSP